MTRATRAKKPEKGEKIISKNGLEQPQSQPIVPMNRSDSMASSNATSQGSSTPSELEVPITPPITEGTELNPLALQPASQPSKEQSAVTPTVPDPTSLPELSNQQPASMEVDQDKTSEQAGSVQPKTKANKKKKKKSKDLSQMASTVSKSTDKSWGQIKVKVFFTKTCKIFQF